MKTLKDLFEIMAMAVESNKKNRGQWFINYSGHVDKVDIKYYFNEWKPDAHCESMNVDLTDDGIQAAYWFIKTKLY
jgi:hypothetical protein